VAILDDYLADRNRAGGFEERPKVLGAFGPQFFDVIHGRFLLHLGRAQAMQKRGPIFRVKEKSEGMFSGWKRAGFMKQVGNLRSVMVRPVAAIVITLARLAGHVTELGALVIDVSSAAANPLSRSRNWRADGYGCRAAAGSRV